MNRLLRIGQVSNLYGISLDTLRYYDRKGLLTPIVDEQNGYRYYSAEQLDTLELILVAKHLEIPLELIKAYIQSESIAGYQSMLQKQMQQIEYKQESLRQLLDHNTHMLDLLKRIEHHRNDTSFSSVQIKRNVNITIFKAELKMLLQSRTDSDSVIPGVESFNQWIFHNVNEEGEITEDDQTIGFSYHGEIAHAKKLHEYLNQMTKEGRSELSHLRGSYRHICFWGKEAELKQFLELLCKHFKLRNSEVHIHFGFALLHKDNRHDYWAEIYFPE